MLAFSLLLGNNDILFVVLFSSLHEIGHIISLYALHGKAKTITLSYYGIGLKHNSNLSNLKMIVFLLSGVVANLFFIAVNIKREINAALFFINILPLYPLDGGRALKIIIDSVLDYKKSLIIFKTITCISILLLIILAVYLKNLSLIFISLYIIIYSISNSFE